MKHKFHLDITSLESVDELSSPWPPEACLALLKHLEFADAESIETGPLREYAVMALQDLEVEEAAYALLDFAFGDELTKGKKQNIAEDMQREPLWDKYPDLAYKEPIFNLLVLKSQSKFLIRKSRDRGIDDNCAQPAVGKTICTFL